MQATWAGAAATERQARTGRRRRAGARGRAGGGTTLGWAAAAAVVLSAPGSAQAQVISFEPRSCLSSVSPRAPAEQRLNLTRVYAQFDQGQRLTGEHHAQGIDFGAVPAVIDANGDPLTGSGTLLRFVLIGDTGAAGYGYSNSTPYLSTLVQDTDVLTFPVAANQSALCPAIRTSDHVYNASDDSGCPYGPGEIALGVAVPLASSYALTSITTRIVVLDSSVPAANLACYELDVTPYYPEYPVYPFVLWLAVALVLAYGVLYVAAQLWAAVIDFENEYEAQLASSLTLKLSSPTSISWQRRLRAIWFGAWSSKLLTRSGSLRRFVTPELSEIFALAAWFSLVGTVAVNWPDFAYPFFARLSWTALIYNNTLPFASAPSGILDRNADLPASFASQIAQDTSPLYLDTSLPNVLLDLDSYADGIERWAAAVGVRHQDLFSICAYTFFALVGVVVAFHLVIFLIATVSSLVLPSKPARVLQPATLKSRDDRPSSSILKDGSETSKARMSSNADAQDDVEVLNGWGERQNGHRPGAGAGVEEEEEDEPVPEPEQEHASWRLHLASLHGNLVRLLFFFHFPLTLFSMYQLTIKDETPPSTFALAIVVYALICVIAPLYLLWRIHRADVDELYLSTLKLLEIGPLYNTYAEECSMFAGVRFAGSLIVATVIGAAHASGIAQGITILLVEVANTLITSLWLPWADHSAMTALAFAFSLAKIVIAVMAIVLAPLTDVSHDATGWVTYVVFIAQALAAFILVCVVFVKMLELVVRLIGGAPFDQSRSRRGGGLLGALRRADRSNRRRRGRGEWSRARAIAKRRRRNQRRAQRTAASNVRPSPRQKASTGTVGTINTTTAMLGPKGVARPEHSRASSGFSMQSYAEMYVPPSPNAPGQEEEDGFIMSAMSSGPWVSQGYMAPGAYRQSAAWSNPSTPGNGAGGSTGFARVAGGRATDVNPYEISTPMGQYPPYPASSADMYAPSPAAHARTQSHSAIVEMLPNQQTRPTRPSLQLGMPSARLLSNNLTPRDDSAFSPQSPHAVPRRQARQPRGGFFGRFRNRLPGRHRDAGGLSDGDDYLSDDTFTTTDGGESEEEEERVADRVRPALWPFGRVGKATRRQRRSLESSRPPSSIGRLSEGGDDDACSSRSQRPSKSFQVVRKPRPRPANQSTSARDSPASSKGKDAAEGQRTPSSPPTPRASSRGPAPQLARPRRSSSLLDELGLADLADDEQ